MTNNTPAAAFRYGRVHTAVWSRPSKRSDGTSFTQWSVSLERRYKNKSGAWQSTDTFDPQDGTCQHF
jgi:hypothetical protein